MAQNGFSKDLVICKVTDVPVPQDVPEGCKKEIKCTDPASLVFAVNTTSMHSVIRKVLSPEG